jgi:hypothetical protein
MNRLFASVVCAVAALLGVLVLVEEVGAQTYTIIPDEDLPVETVIVTIANPSADKARNQRIEDAVRRSIALFPGSRFSSERAEFAMNIARRDPNVADITYSLSPGVRVGVVVSVTVTLADGQPFERGRGYFLTGDTHDLPVLYDKNGTMLLAKLEALALYYGNNNAWYGHPEAMLAGNPLVQGRPAGAGYTDWGEAYVQYGIYGITPLSQNTYAYGGLSSITSGSAGQELFTDLTRTYTAIEDAYAGIVSGRTDDAGNRLTVNLTAGRARFTLANAFLISNTAQNGYDRAALQANARWAADELIYGAMTWNSTRLEAFYVAPNELPILDTDTRIAGLNFQTDTSTGWRFAGSWLTVPKSTQAYFAPDGTVVGTRQGMKLFDLRFAYTPPDPTKPGPFFGGEIARQTNRLFDMDAWAGYGEVGYSFPHLPWSPAVSYRVGYFSGDDPDTPAYERWDPLLSGGNGEQWVQGINHFKVVQDSNVIAHRIQARLRVTPRVELVPQLWAFYAASLNNIGGNPALTFLAEDEYGFEANITAKWFVSRRLYVHGDIAYTVPGKAVQSALSGKAKDWFSAMLFVRRAL